MTACAVPKVDPAVEAVAAFQVGMLKAFDGADSVLAPEGGGSDKVWLIYGDNNGIPWGPENRGKGGCASPFLWVRLDRRYRSRVRDFPSAYVGHDKCGEAVIRVAAVEVGIARCVDASPAPKLSKVEDEASVALDDSWRIGLAMDTAAQLLPKRAVATDTIAAIGPDGGMIAWTGMAYVQL